MGRKKQIIYAVESIHPDTRRSQDDKYVTNFICYANGITTAFKENSRRGIWNDKTAPDEVKNILSIKEKGNKKPQFFFNEEVCVDDVLNLSEKVKLSDDYVYMVRDWENSSWPKEVYGTEKEALAYIDKKIKNKFVHLVYDGIDETVEYSPNELQNIIARMANNTNPINIAQVTRGEDEYWYEIKIFKNGLKL